MKVRYYAVSRGRKPGIYNDWAVAEKQVRRFRFGDLRRFCCFQDCFNYLISQKLTSSDLQFDCRRYSDRKRDPSGKFYAVAAGRSTGLYCLWDDMKDLVLGFKGAKWEVFHCLHDAEYYLNREGLCSYYKALGRGVESFNPLENIRFRMDRSGEVEVHVAGDFFENERDGPAAGIGVWFKHNHPLNLSAPVDGYKVSYLIARVQAVTAACRIAIAFGIPMLEIYIDSEYAIQYIMGWCNLWAKKYADLHGDLVDADSLLELRRVLEKVYVFFHLVAANSDIEGNVGANQLARSGAIIFQKLHKLHDTK